ncbi:MAG TPA: MOSC N-terminal beta barrel domain-containing protein [Chloroflexaceae bacterium]|nr:MOSC N-terminal beta barrel domain-containing protein [Chloroflexaceae bacterium]
MTRPPAEAPLGTVAALWRYPVKSMGGEPVEAAELTERGLLGDRVYALLDRETGTVVSAKHPRRWPSLLACSAGFVAPPRPGEPPPPVRITLPDGTMVRSDDPDVDALLSRALGRAVALVTSVPGTPLREADRTPVGAEGGEREIRREPLARGAPPGTFFDYGPAHLLTTATLAFLQTRYPEGCFDPRRFRPNLLVDTGAAVGLVEHAWLGRGLATGAARAPAIDPCPRRVVTTLPQGDLPRDPGILRAITAHSAAPSATLAPGVVFPAVAGIYLATVAGGQIRRGDQVLLLP